MYVYAGANSTTGIFDTSIEEPLIYPLGSDAKFEKNTLGYFEIISPSAFLMTSGAFAGWTIPGYSNIRLVGFDGTNTIKSKMIYKVTRKQVTEKFVDGTGVAITPPTGFTQNKKTPMTSNKFTYTSAKTLPDTYKVGSKTYKFKGWYKGKTKPATLKTTKTPRYAVTYDDNDDLNVVYEETNFPELTYQFGFVNEAGQLVNPADIAITYDYINIAYRGRGSLNDSVSFEMIESNRAATVGNLIKVVFPASYVARPVETGWNGEAYSSFSIRLPKYYQTLNLYDKTGKINPKYPLPGITIVNNPEANIVKTEAQVISDLTLTQRADKSFTPTETYVVVNPGVKYPKILYTSIHSNNLASGLMSYSTVNNPIYYHLTNRKVTENFVDATGAKITPPTGFTQGQQTSITSNDFTYTSAKALPDTYKASNGKTYKFKGWYKGKTKPATLKMTKTPSYAVTYDDNDDLNVVYEEIAVLEFPSRTYQFGFVDESGNRVDASTIDLTYDNWYGIGTKPPNNSPSAWATTKIETGIKANTKNNLKEITYPVHSLETNGKDSFQFSAANLRYHLPRFYKSISVKNQQGGFDDAYPYPTILSSLGTEISNSSQYFELKNNGGQEFVFDITIAAASENVQIPAYLRDISSYSSRQATYYTIQGPIYYYLTNRKVTENFVDASGAKITPPTGFTQGKQTAITSDPYTFKQVGTLPDTYKAGTKTYKFKGWYKGKTKPATLKTTKTPSYAVTYDDNDDMTAVYEEVKDTAVHPGFYAEFVDEQGKAFTNPLTLSGNYTEYLRKIDNSPFEATGSLYPMVGSKDATVANRYKVETKQSVSIPNNFFEDYPADILHKGFALNNFDITNELKYVDQVEATTKTITLYDYDTISDIGTNLLSDSVTASLNSFETVFNREVNNTFSVKAKWGQPGIARETIPNLLALGSISSKPRLLGFDGTSDYKQTINYKVTRKQVTENFVDAVGVKITAPTGFTQGKQTPMTSNTFKYTAAKALPASYSAGGKTYTFQGWYKGKTKPTTLSKATTPTFSATFDGNDDMTAVYKEEVPKASVTLTRTTAETVTSGGNVTWRATITNTSQAPLTTATIKKSTAWTAGLAAPTAMIVTPVGGTAKTVPVTATTWTNGVSLGVNIPVGKSATVQFTTKATGTAGKVLRAGITTSGNYSGVSASATVRVKDNDQAIVTPTAEGFISTPTFDFGQVAISGTKQQYGLKKAAAYYGNGTRNPYLRIKKTQPNWSLTAQLSQPKSATDSLPTATRLLLGAAPVSSFSNYNQPTELKNTIGTTKVINLTANNTATNIVANQQFTGSDVYQLDFVFDNIKLEVPASQGMTRQQYQAAVTWNLVTGP
ncbi:WxL domain-containing protein [Enterococcus faecalis]